MATTKIADVIVPEVLSSMASAEISNFLDFEKTGLCSADYNNVDIREGGHFAEVRFYNQLDATTDVDEVLEDDKSLTPGKSPRAKTSVLSVTEVKRGVRVTFRRSSPVMTRRKKLPNRSANTGQNGFARLCFPSSMATSMLPALSEPARPLPIALMSA